MDLRNLRLLIGALVLSITAQAQAAQYVVSFKNSHQFQATSAQLNRDMVSMGAFGRAGKVTLMNTKAEVKSILNQVEMLIVDTNDASSIEAIRQHPGVLSVEREYFIPSPKPLSRRGQMNMPYGIEMVRAPQAWSTTKGQGARIAILDTGIDQGHPNLNGNFEKGRSFVGLTGEEDSQSLAEVDPSDFTDQVGHGTHVAGTIAADGKNGGLVGVAPEAKVLMGKVCGTSSCSSTAILQGIDWAIQEKVDAISMSLGGPFPNSAQERAVMRAVQAKIAVVAASGNDGQRSVSYPAAIPAAIAVGAVDEAGQRAEFSNYGPGLDIVAPGVEVLSSVPRGMGKTVTTTIDSGDGKGTNVNSMPVDGGLANETPVGGSLVFAGLGKPEDFSKADVRGKFALIERGEISFKDKTMNAVKAGATGVVIYNNAEGLVRGTLGEGVRVQVPVVMIEQTVGQQVRDALAQGQAATASIVMSASDFERMSGTSMATPHVSGVVALVKAANPNLTAEQVTEVLTSTAQSMGDTDQYGSGLVNAEEAVKKAQSIQ